MRRSSQNQGFRRFQNGIHGLCDWSTFRGAESIPPYEFLALDRKKILVFATMGIGDVLMLAASVKALKKKIPDSEIVALSSPYSGAKDLLPHMSFIDRVMVFDWAIANRSQQKTIQGLLRSERFSALLATYTAPIRFFMKGLENVPIRAGAVRQIDLPPSMTLSEKIQWKIRMNLIQEELFKRRFFNHPVVVTQKAEHEIEKGHRLVKRIMDVEPDTSDLIHIPSDANSTASDLLAPIKDRPIIAIHASASPGQKWKSWPIEKYKMLLEKISLAHAVNFALFGSADEREGLMDLEKSLTGRAVSLVGKTSLIEAAACLKRCQLFVGSDSGIGHMAIALDIPAVRLFGPSDQPGYAAWRPGNHADVTVPLDCRPCLVSGIPRPGTINYENCPHFDCLNKMSVDQVYAIVAARL